jgi:hypothetical protein
MIQADVKLDTLGYFCPMPIILTSKKIKELTMGQVLEVVSDDEGICRLGVRRPAMKWWGLRRSRAHPSGFTRPSSKNPSST